LNRQKQREFLPVPALVMKRQLSSPEAARVRYWLVPLIFVINVAFWIYCATLNLHVKIFFVAQKRKIGRGRPKFPHGEARSELLRVRVSLDEMKLFATKARRAKTSFPAWVRKTLTDAP
jgi:hypothetical protein